MIEKMLVLSTAHLKPETCNTLLPGLITSYPVWDKGDYGWFIYLVDDRDNLADDLDACMAFAEQQNCEWIMFDRDAPEIEHLPIHNW